jgi:twitching motility protein PilT
MEKLLDVVVDQNASDLHLVVKREPVVRIDGKLRTLKTKVLTPDDTMTLMKSITPERNQQELQEVGGTDFSFAYGDKARFRVSCYKDRGTVAVAMRLIPNTLMTFEEIGLPTQVKNYLVEPRGLILVTGPTGCGKTTTLATMIDFINENLDRHIITIEDPIEFYHEHKRSIINQRAVGEDVTSFAEALRRVLRADPDVILVGEMRDLETISAALRAAETGHLVFATLHTTSAEGSINRIIDAYPTDQQEQIRVQLSVTIVLILSQQLLPRSSGKGRIAGFECMTSTAAIRNLIRENKTYRVDSQIETGKKYGMVLLDDHLLQLYQDGLVTLDDALYKARKPMELKQKIDEWDAAHARQAQASRAGL